MSNATLFFSRELLDLVAARYMAANFQLFDVSLTSPVGLTAYCKVGGPAFDLSARTDGRTFSITFATATVSVVPTGQPPSTPLPIDVTVAGSFALAASGLALTDLVASAVGTDTLSVAVAGLVNQHAIPSIAANVARLWLPNLTELIGAATTIDGLRTAPEGVWASATVGDGSGDEPGFAPFSLPGAGGPVVIVAVAGSAIAAIAHGQITFPIKASKDYSWSVVGEGFAVSAALSITDFDLTVGGGAATASMPVSGTLSGSYELAFDSHRIAEVTIPLASVAVGVGMETQPASARLVVTSIGSISLSPSFDDSLPGFVTDALDSVLSQATQILASTVASALDNVGVNAVVLPEVVSAFGINGTPSLVWTGFLDAAVLGIVQVAAPPTYPWANVAGSGSVIGIVAMRDGSLLGIGLDDQLYTRATLTSPWTNIAGSGDVTAVTQLQDGTIVGVGLDQQLYTRTDLQSPWVQVPASGDVAGVTQLADGTVVGIGMDHQLYTRATLTSPWVNVPGSGEVIAVTGLQDGTLLGVGTDHQLYARATLTSPWVNVANSGAVLGVTQMTSGMIVGIGLDHQLYLGPWPPS